MVQVDIAGAELAGGVDQTLDMLVERDIARQERQRIGIACRLHAHFGDRADQVGAGAQPDIAALLGDQEAIGQRACVLCRQDLRHFLQRRAALEARRFAVGHGNAGLLAIQLAVERCGVAVDKALAADDGKRPSVVMDHRHGMQLRLVLEHAQHRVVAGGGRYGRCRTQQPPGGHAGPARAHHLRKHGDMPGRQRAPHLRCRVRIRVRRRPADVVALRTGHAEVADHGKFFLMLDSLGNDAPAEGAHHAHYRTQYLQPPRA
ncbi:hypothetical protein D9M68_441180 [compost metagenome]